MVSLVPSTDKTVYRQPTTPRSVLDRFSTTVKPKLTIIRSKEEPTLLTVKAKAELSTPRPTSTTFRPSVGPRTVKATEELSTPKSASTTLRPKVGPTSNTVRATEELSKPSFNQSLSTPKPELLTSTIKPNLSFPKNSSNSLNTSKKISDVYPAINLEASHFSRSSSSEGIHSYIIFPLVAFALVIILVKETKN